MKKRKIFVLCMLILLTLCSSVLYLNKASADANAGSTGTGPGSGSASGTNYNVPYGLGSVLFLRVSLVYYDGNNTINIGEQHGHKYIYVYYPSCQYKQPFGGFNSGNFNRNRYETINVASGSSLTSGWLSCSNHTVSFDADAFMRTTVGNNAWPSEQQYEVLEPWLNKFGVTREELTNESCNVHEEGQGNCYGKKGYRLIGEQMVLRGTGQEVAFSELSDDCRNKRHNVCLTSQEVRNSISQRTDVMHIEWQDINYYCPGGNCSPRDDLNCAADGNCGWGIWIVDISGALIPYDYSIDAACVNCNSTDEENKAYFIQDTPDWKAIHYSTKYKASDAEKTKNIQNYFIKNPYGTYCREEYLVKFPNQTNTIQVSTGRYFTVNPSLEEQQLVTVSGIPNFKPIQVTKTRYCQGGNLEAFRTNANVIREFKDEEGSTGKVYFKYIENTKNSRYSMSEKQEMRRYDEPDEYVNQINGDTLKMSVTYSYTLPKQFYQYVRKSDGLSVHGPIDDAGSYEDVKISNLPISFTNYSFHAADLKFSYELPTTDAFSKMYLAYDGGDNLYLTDNKVDSIYKRYLANNLSAEGKTEITQSACARMFGMGTSAFETCARNRQSNKIGDGGYNCFVLDSMIDDNNVSTGYSCLIRSNNKCEYRNGKFYDANGNEITEEEYNSGKCVPETGPQCSITTDNKGNTIYFGKYGTEVSKEEYDEQCSNPECPPNEVCEECPPEVCPYGCCPDGSCAPMPDGTCPGYGGIDVIYRTIDLENPFPGQGAEQRNTGSNWCSYSIRTQKIDCNHNNQTVKNYITRERGGTVNGGKVYRENHILYEVTLDSNTIASIRSYNDKNKYDDWTLKCEDNGRACISEFLRSEVQTSGVCSKVNGTNFYTCDKDV